MTRKTRGAYFVGAFFVGMKKEDIYKRNSHYLILILYKLAKNPLTVSDIAKESVETRFGNVIINPSPDRASTYRWLSFAEENNLVISVVKNDKTVYCITKNGIDLLKRVLHE